MSASYAVGIDLGTTNSVLSYVELASTDEQLNHQVLPIPQLTKPGNVEEKLQLPSFLYQAHEAELAPNDRQLPWPNTVLVGCIARELGSKTPIRLLASAKSWLCHADVDRHADFLPFNSPDEVSKISPVEASYQYLKHLQQAWDYRFPHAPLSQQDVTLTVPASFDPAARDLTAAAAKRVGLEHLTLLEEPQAALYSWVESNPAWRKQVKVGEIILVVDVGGGTTDFSLVVVTEQDGALSLSRIAVGDHILLGGDNMDLALAYRIKAKLAQQGKNLQPWQVQGITQACRDAKEQLLVDSHVQAVAIVVPSRGSSLIGGLIRTEVTRQEVLETLVEGFFPVVEVSEHPAQTVRGALKQMGLPYAQDAAISRHLAAFLCRQHNAAQELLGVGNSDFIKPTAVLFNGGVFKAPALVERIMTNLNLWLENAGHPAASVLQGIDLDLAVARGAAYYGYVRQGQGVRIRGGIASSFYVGIESAMPAIPGMEPPLEALCVAPFGMEEGGQEQGCSQIFGLVIGEPVRFRFFGSTTRRSDAVGTLLDYWEPEELENLPDIQATLPADGRKLGEVVPVKLVSRVTELGTLCLEAVALDGKNRWKVEFEVRGN